MEKKTELKITFDKETKRNIVKKIGVFCAKQALVKAAKNVCGYSDMPLGEKIIVGTGIQIVASMSVEGVPGFIDRKLDELAEAIVDIQEFLNGDAE